MEKEKLNFKINYKNIRVFEEKNADKPQFPLVLSVPHSGTFFPEEFLQNVAVIQRKKLFLQSVIAINLYHDMKIRRNFMFLQTSYI
jgi:hypothetical protein